ncbi:RNA polymerase sigma factor [Polyangium fumosum]|uniref:Sigma-70 family RNA polymerase sigma factor n=1 Tax=Polyangium fumosum TaxID=889272 RepID=A0A4U1IUI5_9BACT|nr:sigma-70 family RNA polymerase sigma factor [Polyangium fumosum]TKC98019.1 sigma-70 family RNA polymerase sigma factor [Polyangium fumosum]
MGRIHRDASPQLRAFMVLYDKHHQTIVRRLQKLGVRAADLEDIVQMVLIKVYKGIEKLPVEEDGIEPWLFCICAREAASHYRLRRHRYEAPEPNAGVQVADETSLHERLEDVELVADVLEQMKPEQAKILLLHELDEKTLPETAKELGISRNTAQARLADAKEVFQRRVERSLTPNTPARRRRLALLPFGLGAFSATESDAGTPPSGKRLIAPRAPSSSMSPRALLRAARPVLERLFKNPAFWGVTGTLGGLVGGFIGGMSVPRGMAKPVREVRPMVTTVVIEVERAGQEAVRDAPSPVTPTVSASASSPALTVPAATSNPWTFPGVPPERRGIEHARHAVQRGNFTEAIAVLQQHEREYPDSQYRTVRARYMAEARRGLVAIKVMQEDTGSGDGRPAGMGVGTETR